MELKFTHKRLKKGYPVYNKYGDLVPLVKIALQKSVFDKDMFVYYDSNDVILDKNELHHKVNPLFYNGFICFYNILLILSFWCLPILLSEKIETFNIILFIIIELFIVFSIYISEALTKLSNEYLKSKLTKVIISDKN